MGLFDIFTNDSAKEAASKNRAIYDQYGRDASAALGSYGTNAGQLFQDYGSAGDNFLTGAATSATGALDAGKTASVGAFGRAIQAGQAGVDAYAPLTALGSKYAGATSLQQDALGVNGPEGAARAKAAFTTGPGYQFEVDQATDAAARNAAKLGLAGSGNTLDEIRNRAEGIAGREYGSWLDRLGQYINPELAATSGAASGRAGAFNNLGGIFRGEAGLYDTDAARRAGLFTDLGAARTGVAGTEAAARAGVGKDVAQGTIGIEGNVASGGASANNAEAQAAQNGSATFWNGLFNLGGNAAKVFAPKLPA